MFISYYTIIYFFVKNFFSNVSISANTIFECSYLSFGWKIGHPLSLYVTREMEGVIQNVCRCAQGEKSITLHVYIGNYSISFHVFVIWCLVLFVEIQPYLHSKSVCLSDMVIFIQWDQFLLQWNTRFLLTLFISPQKLFLFSRYLSFCLDYLLMYWKGLRKKVKG